MSASFNVDLAVIYNIMTLCSVGLLINSQSKAEDLIYFKDRVIIIISKKYNFYHFSFLSDDCVTFLHHPEDEITIVGQAAFFECQVNMSLTGITPLWNITKSSKTMLYRKTNLPSHNYKVIDNTLRITISNYKEMNGLHISCCVSVICPGMNVPSDICSQSGLLTVIAGTYALFITWFQFYTD